MPAPLPASTLVAVASFHRAFRAFTKPPDALHEVAQELYAKLITM